MTTKEEAMAIARVELQKRGMSPSDYNASVDENTANPSNYLVLFDLKGPYPIPGGRHIVLVDKTSGRAVFMKGQ